MSALREKFWDGIEQGGLAASVRIQETPYGFRFCAPHRKWGAEVLAEVSLKCFALTIMIASSLLWFVPLAQFSMGGAGRSAITAISMLVGYAVYRYANRGFMTEYEVDSTFREVRVITRNTNNETVQRRKIPMRSIQSGFIRRHQNPRHASQLNIRLQGRGDPMPLVAGAEADLLPVLERMMLDIRLRAPNARKVEPRHPLA